MPTMPDLDPKELLGVESGAMPRHVAVIMDGNGRWAKQRGLMRIEGHRHGAEAVRETVTHCARLGIECLTLYSFSLENWKRPKLEVDGLMALYAQYLVAERREIMENDIRVLQLGRREGLPDSVLRELDRTMQMSRDNNGLTLCLALNYAGRAEIIDAARALARKAREGELDPDQIDEAMFADQLTTRGLPDPDLLVRTAGQMRISNFLLWQISYAELYVTEVLWPDFRAEHLNEALRAYAARERRFGAVPEQR
jgi:undecaprenyl diphosphate synthase